MKKEILELVNNTDMFFIDIDGLLVSLGFYSTTKLVSDSKPIVEINADEFDYTIFEETCSKITNSITPVIANIINILSKDNRIQYNLIEKILNNKPAIKVSSSLTGEFYVCISTQICSYKHYQITIKPSLYGIEWDMHKIVMNICGIISMISFCDINNNTKKYNSNRNILGLYNSNNTIPPYYKDDNNTVSYYNNFNDDMNIPSYYKDDNNTVSYYNNFNDDNNTVSYYNNFNDDMSTNNSVKEYNNTSYIYNNSNNYKLNDKKIKEFESYINKLLNSSYSFTILDEVKSAYNDFISIQLKIYKEVICNNIDLIQKYKNGISIILDMLINICNFTLIPEYDFLNKDLDFLCYKLIEDELIDDLIIESGKNIPEVFREVIKKLETSQRNKYKRTVPTFPGNNIEYNNKISTYNIISDFISSYDDLVKIMKTVEDIVNTTLNTSLNFKNIQDVIEFKQKLKEHIDSYNNGNLINI